MNAVAIIGQGALLPGAADARAYAANVLSGHDAVRDVSPGRWGIPERDVTGTGRDRTWSLAGGYVDGFAWDPDGFRISAADLSDLDPLVLWLLHTARAALGDAGLAVGDPALRR